MCFFHDNPTHRSQIEARAQPRAREKSKLPLWDEEGPLFPTPVVRALVLISVITTVPDSPVLAEVKAGRRRSWSISEAHEHGRLEFHLQSSTPMSSMLTTMASASLTCSWVYPPPMEQPRSEGPGGM